MEYIYVKVKNIGQLKAVIDDEKVAAVICGPRCISELVSKEFISRIKKIKKNSGKKLYIELPDIIREKSLFDVHRIYSKNEPEGFDKDIMAACNDVLTKEKEFRPQQLMSVEKILEGIRTKQIYADGVVIENLDALGMLAWNHYQGEVIGGSFLYAYNSEAVKFYRNYFPDIKFIAPDELTLKEIEKIKHNESAQYLTGEFETNENIPDEVCNAGKLSNENMPYGICNAEESSNKSNQEKFNYENTLESDENIVKKNKNTTKKRIKPYNYEKKEGTSNIIEFIYKVYGHQPVMITNQCMNRNYCGCKKPLLEFRDEKNNNFYITSECSQCYDIIYNGPVTYMLDRLSEIGNCDLLLDFTIETPEEVEDIMGILERSLAGEKIKIEKYTRGHIYNGID